MNTKELVKKYNHIFHTDFTQDANCQLAWLFSEGSGTSVADESPNGRAGTFASANNPAWQSADVPAGHDYAVTFGSTSKYIYNTDFNLAASGFTLITLIKPTNNATPNKIGSSRSGSNTGWAVNLNTYNNTGYIGVTYFGKGDYASTVAPANDWEYYAITNAASSNTIKVYRGANTSNISVVKSTPGYAGIIAGCGHRSSGYIEPLYGYMAEFAYFDRELTSTEIAEINANGLKGAAAVGRRLLLTGVGR